MNKSLNIDARILKQLHVLLPPGSVSRLALLTADVNIDKAQKQAEFRALLESVNWHEHQQEIAVLLHSMLPIEQLVPDVYAKWRPIVKDALIFVAGHLSSNRLVPKLLDQLTQAGDLTLEQRLMLFISKMPTLQKLGQIIARNRHISAALQEQLVFLENSISDVTFDQIITGVRQQAGSALEKHEVLFKEEILAEASVSAVIGFSWLNPQTGNREDAVYKVLKPGIHEYFHEEMDLLTGFVDFLHTKRDCSLSADLDLRKIFEDIRLCLEQELDTGNEQRNLQAACNGYSDVADIRVPRLIPQLSLPGLTAMTAEVGEKVTDAYANRPAKRRQLSSQIIEALIIAPLFSAEEQAVFHADPHAGNLFVDEKTGELIILDWALTAQLNRHERRQLCMLIAAVMLRDEQLILKTLMSLCQDNAIDRERLKALIHGHLTDLPGNLSPAGLANFSQVLHFLDDVVLAGLGFSAAVLIFRKVLFTLDGVLHDVADDISLDSVVERYWVSRGTTAVYDMIYPQHRMSAYQFPLHDSDIVSLTISAQWYGLRTGLQTLEQFAKS